jgi:DNA-3-methyladenine glycosylase I
MISDMATTEEIGRCSWAGEDPQMRDYHDHEWGVELRDGPKLFELLLLEGFQAGLSWSLILRRREAFREALAGFDPERLARFDDRQVEALLQNPGIVRHRGKLQGAVRNAQAYLRLEDGHGPFSEWVWGFVGGEPLLPKKPLHAADVPAQTEESKTLSKALRKAGFTFVGPTIVYAFMQSAGLVDDHVVGCFRYRGPLPASTGVAGG